MKRKTPFSCDFLKLPPEISSHPVKPINDACTEFLYKPYFLQESLFPDIVRKIPSFLLNPAVSVGLFKQSECSLLPGSQLDANNLFGMEIERYSHISEIEISYLKINHRIEKYVKLLFKEETKFDIHMKRNRLTINNKEIQNNRNKYGISFSVENDTLFIKLSKNKILSKSSSISVESDIPIVFEKCELTIHTLRIVAPEIHFQSKIVVEFLDILCKSNCLIEGEITCNTFFLLRSPEVSIKTNLNGQKLLIISSRTVFTKYETNFDTLLIYSKNEFKCSSNFKIEKLFLYSENVNFLANKGNLDIQQCHLQGENLTIGKNLTAKSVSVETSNLSILKTSKIEIETKLNLFFVSDSQTMKIGKNEGILKCYDLFFEVNSTDSSPISSRSFVNMNAMSVTNAFLLSSGTFLNNGNVSFRSFYVASFSHFLSKKTSSIKIGDLLVIESHSSFSIEGKILPFAYLKPVFLNSGKFFIDLSNHSLNQQSKPQTSNSSSQSNNSSNPKLNQTVNNMENVFVCKKFISNGEIEGVLMNIDSQDLISISGKVNCKEINFKANKIAIIGGTEITTDNFLLNCISCELNFAKVKSNNNEEGIVEINFEEEYLNNNCQFLNFASIVSKKVPSTFSPTTPGNQEKPKQNTEPGKSGSNLILATPENGSKRAIPKITDD
ncbi:hypothetical protein TRFO_37162 [Tritrichomonas foetus]|uniref:Uncharacterized protein n=1 Tax=Tritrichomonas foetus TaxID=1144522 RepID=A0A1J4JG44_9EUKA|nr:hypothetical protein TRFO_37162 [Tritrichomonas foetus]|eukprot:OHS96619.1 hypothetical protein TRFO_37162 [Tritrichomonas foetus]